MSHHSWQPFCAIGDVVEFVASVATNVGDGETPQDVAAGATYVVIGLVENGWDLRRVDGLGPLEVRILNSNMPRFVRHLGSSSSSNEPT